MVVHLDDVDTVERDFGHIRGLRQRLGAAAGSREIGCSRWRMAPGKVPAPMHMHADEEEILFVLSGSGHALYGDRAFPIGPGDAMVFVASGEPHTVIAGSDGLDVLAFGSGSASRLIWVARSDTMWLGSRWLPRDTHPFEAEQALGPIELPAPVDPADERPRWLVAATDVEAMPITRGETNQTLTDLGRGGGSRVSGLVHVEIAPGGRGNPPHCHSAEEELFYVLDGAGTLELHERDGVVTHPVRAGSVVARPPGTGVSHAFRAGPDEPLTLLAYGQRDPRDTCFYPEDSTVRLQGLGGLRFRVEPVEE